MKKKKVVIVYHDNGNFSTKMAHQGMIFKIRNEMIEEGRKVVSYRDGVVSFDDGSFIASIKFGKPTIGMRLTHMYIDESVLFLPNGEEIVDKAYLPSIIDSASKAYSNMNYDTESNDRAFSYRVEEGQFKFNSLSED